MAPAIRNQLLGKPLVISLKANDGPVVNQGLHTLNHFILIALPVLEFGDEVYPIHLLLQVKEKVYSISGPKSQIAECTIPTRDCAIIPFDIDCPIAIIGREPIVFTRPSNLIFG
jgi:hypothetical protein